MKERRQIYFSLKLCSFTLNRFEGVLKVSGESAAEDHNSSNLLDTGWSLGDWSEFFCSITALKTTATVQSWERKCRSLILSISLPRLFFYWIPDKKQQKKREIFIFHIPFIYLSIYSDEIKCSRVNSADLFLLDDWLIIKCIHLYIERKHNRILSRSSKKSITESQRRRLTTFRGKWFNRCGHSWRWGYSSDNFFHKRREIVNMRTTQHDACTLFVHHLNVIRFFVGDTTNNVDNHFARSREISQSMCERRNWSNSLLVDMALLCWLTRLRRCRTRICQAWIYSIHTRI